MRFGSKQRVMSIVAGAAVAALIVSATASGATRTRSLSGPVVGDTNATVSIKVVVRNGKPKKLKGLVYENLDAHCDPDGILGPEPPVPAGELSGDGGKNVGPAIEFDRSFRWVSYPDGGARTANIVGKVNRRGTKVTGTLEVGVNTGACMNAKAEFTARR